MSVLRVDGLRVALEPTGDDIISDVGFEVAAGQLVALVGESGSGKTTTAMALLGYARGGARITAGTVNIDDTNVVPATRNSLRRVRGRLIAYVPQDPGASLNPALRIRTQIEETLVAHRICATKRERMERVQRLMDEVRLPSDSEFLARFPHQLSGGQQQRVCMALALCCEPRGLVLDEPTTGLDVTTQAHVLQSLRDVVSRRGIAAVYVTHDLAVVATIADRVIVMYAGSVVEHGDRAQIFRQPAHPYTARLIAAIPDPAERRTLEVIRGRAPGLADRPDGCAFAPRCDLATDECRAARPAEIEVAPGHIARCVHVAELQRGAFKVSPAPPRATLLGDEPVLSAKDLSVVYGSREVVHSVSFDLKGGECLALVGESGSGKTTLSRALVGLTPLSDGAVWFKGKQLPGDVRRNPIEARRGIQYIFQSPYASLNPRRTVRAILQTPLEHFFGGARRDVEEKIARVIERVSLSSRVLDLVPGRLSGGERQRVAIARALVCEPEILICDEITSALDVSVQAGIVQLLHDLQSGEGLSLLFVTHNMGLVRSIADRVMVMDQGRIVEQGATDSLLDAPQDAYTRVLVADTPTMAAAFALAPEH